MKTNLFKGDRVKLSQRYINSHDGLTRFVLDRVGTIVTDTTGLRYEGEIKVHWDGNVKANRCDAYAPDELTLVEGEDALPGIGTGRSKRKANA